MIKEFIRENRVGGQLAHHDHLEAVLTTAKSMFFQEAHHACAFRESPYERNHDLDVCQAHGVAYVLQRLTLHGKAISEIGGEITCCAAVPDHRVLFVWLVA